MSAVQHFVRRDDGMWLCGGGATAVAPEKPDAPFMSFSAAMAAVDRYRIVAAIYASQRAKDGFTLFSA